MIYLGIIGGIFLVEFVIKTIVEKKGKIGVTKPVCGGKILLRKYHNKGFALNAGEKRQKTVAAISLLLCVLMTLGTLLFGNRWNSLAKVGFAILLGGAYSNTYDRLFRTYVVDYISFGVKWERLRRIVFNVADFCIVIGAVLVVIGGLSDENISKGQICSEIDGRLGGTP
ncbi:MAG: signal peptidase II [Lachnospiraceae bacterium]|nr:signal peptidase II [Lachnospiraceae bacterium]